MKSSPDLFQLIKSLTKSEKRYFKLFASLQKGEKKYLKLFNSIDKQVEYSEENIRKEFNHEKFINHLPDRKNHLYYLILKILRVYDRDQSVDVELKGLLHNVKLLFDKGLYNQCEKIISKTRSLAEKYEKHLVLLELSGWEFELMRVQSYQGKPEKETEKFYKDVFRVKNKYSNEKEYEHLLIRMFARIHQQGYTRKDADLKLYQDIINNPLLPVDMPVGQVENKTMTYQALSHYYNIFTAYYFMLNDFARAYSYGQKSVTLMEEHPHLLEERLQEYVAALDNVIICQYSLNKYKEMLLTIKKLKEINTKSRTIKNHIFFIANNMELHTYIKRGAFAQGIKLITSIEGDLNKIGLSKSTKVNLQYIIAYMYFGIGNYREARNYLNEIINDTTVDLRTDIYCMTRVMAILVHYELGHDELLEYMEKSAHRYLEKKMRLYKVETSILDFMRKKIPKISNGKDLTAAFKELRKELEEIMKDPFETKVLDYFDFISWLESKIQNRPFADIIKEKLKENNVAP